MKQSMFFLLGIVLMIGMLAVACFGDAYENDRFKGGSYDGYNLSSKTNIMIQAGLPSGAMLLIR